MTATASASLLNMEMFLEEQAQDFAKKFPSESFQSPKASQTSYINKLLQKKLSPSMNNSIKLLPAKSVADLNQYHQDEHDDLNTADKKKANFKAISKAIATKLAFKNNKIQLFKNQQPTVSCQSQQADSTEVSSEGEQSFDINPVLRASIMAHPSLRSFLYMNSFERVCFEWDMASLSKHLELHLSVP